MNSHDPKSGKLSKKDPFPNRDEVQVWQRILTAVSEAPSPGLGVEIEFQLEMLMLMPERELTPAVSRIAIISAIEGESLSFLVDRLDYEQRNNQ